MISALFAKELRILLRSPKALALLLLSVGLMAGTFLPLWIGQGAFMAFGGRAMAARMLFGTLTTYQILALGLIAALLSATAVCSERERQTLDLLYASNFDAHAILIAKWFACIFFPCLLGFCLLPISSLVFLLGGVGLDEVLAALLATLMTIASCAMVGLACSTKARSSTAAMLKTITQLACLILFFLIFSPLLMWLFMGTASMGSAPGIFRSFSFYCFIGVQALLLSMNWRRALRGLRQPEKLRALPTPDGQELIPLLVAEYKFANQVACPPKPPPVSPNRLQRFLARERQFSTRLGGKISRCLRPFWRLAPETNILITDQRNPVYINELRMTERSARPGAATGFFILYLLFVTAFFTRPTLLDEVGGAAGRAIPFLMLISPIMMAPLIPREREQRTLDLLLTTTLSSREIVWGKFLAGLRLPLRMALGVLLYPILAVLFVACFFLLSFGMYALIPEFRHFGITACTRPWVIVITLPYLTVHAVFFCTISLLCSTLIQRGTVAILTALAGICAILIFGGVYIQPKAILIENILPEFMYLIGLVAVSALLLGLAIWRVDRLRANSFQWRVSLPQPVQSGHM